MGSLDARWLRCGHGALQNWLHSKGGYRTVTREMRGGEQARFGFPRFKKSTSHARGTNKLCRLGPNGTGCCWCLINAREPIAMV